MISNCFEDFAQSLRVFIEQKFRFNELFIIDAPEAIGNLELASKGILDTFASLYDAAKTNPEVEFDFYANPLCCCVLAYRNAKHHNKAHGIRSVHRYAQQIEREDFLLVNFPAGIGEEGGSFVEHFISWGDFSFLLDLPRKQSRLRADAKGLIRERIFADEFECFAAREDVSLHRVFINIIPIIIGAGSELIPHLKPYLKLESTEAKHFTWHFEHVEKADFEKPEYLELSSSIFG